MLGKLITGLERESERERERVKGYVELCEKECV